MILLDILPRNYRLGIKLGLFVDVKCQHERRHNKKLGHLLCADESSLMGNNPRQSKLEMEMMQITISMSLY